MALPPLGHKPGLRALPHGIQCMGVQVEDQEVVAPVEAEAVEAVAQVAVVVDQEEVVVVALQAVAPWELVQQEVVVEGAMVA